MGVVNTINSSTQKAEIGKSLSSRPTWSSEQVPVLPGLHTQTLPGNKETKKSSFNFKIYNCIIPLLPYDSLTHSSLLFSNSSACECLGVCCLPHACGSLQRRGEHGIHSYAKVLAANPSSSVATSKHWFNPLAPSCHVIFYYFYV